PAIAAFPKRCRRAAGGGEITGLDRLFENLPPHAWKIGGKARHRLQLRKRSGWLARFLGEPCANERIQCLAAAIGRRARGGRRKHGCKSGQDRNGTSRLTYSGNWGLRRLQE